MRSHLTFFVFLALQVEAQDICTPCSNNKEFSVDAKYATSFQTNATSASCEAQLETLNGLIADGVGINSTECRNAQLEAFQADCCPDPPYEYCTICPDGGDYDETAIIPMGTASDPQCEVAQFMKFQLKSFFKNGDCSDTLLRRGAFYCGCENTEQQCTVCPDGQEFTQPRRVDAYQSGDDCTSNEYLFSLFTSNECEDFRFTLGVDYAGWCGCPGYVMENDFVCDLCPEGEYVADLDKVHTADNAKTPRTCSQALEFTKFVTLPKICEVNMQEAREQCCVKSGAMSFMTTSFSLTLSVGVMLVKLFLF